MVEPCEEMLVMKQALRKRMATAAKRLSDLEIQQQSEAITRHVIELPEFQQSRSLSVYLHMPKEEATTGQLLQAAFEGSKKVYVPKITGKRAEDMKMVHALSLEDIDSFPRDKWQIPDPPLTTSSTGEVREKAMTALDLDLVLLPGVAFDPMGGRLGHGKGYYDSFLSRLTAQYQQSNKRSFTTVGICLTHQLIGAVPRSSHDIPLNVIVTPNGVLRSSS